MCDQDFLRGGEREERKGKDLDIDIVTVCYAVKRGGMNNAGR